MKRMILIGLALSATIFAKEWKVVNMNTNTCLDAKEKSLTPAILRKYGFKVKKMAIEGVYTSNVQGNMIVLAESKKICLDVIKKINGSRN